MKSILSAVVSRGIPASRLIVLPPPPSDPEAWRLFLEAKERTAVPRSPKSAALSRRYYDVCRAVAAEAGVGAVLDFWDDLNKPEMFVDGLHFSEKGSEVVFRSEIFFVRVCCL